VPGIPFSRTRLSPPGRDFLGFPLIFLDVFLTLVWDIFTPQPLFFFFRFSKPSNDPPFPLSPAPPPNPPQNTTNPPPPPPPPRDHGGGFQLYLLPVCCEVQHNKKALLSIQQLSALGGGVGTDYQREGSEKKFLLGLSLRFGSLGGAWGLWRFFPTVRSLIRLSDCHSHSTSPCAVRNNLSVHAGTPQQNCFLSKTFITWPFPQDKVKRLTFL